MAYVCKWIGHHCQGMGWSSFGAKPLPWTSDEFVSSGPVGTQFGDSLCRPRNIMSHQDSSYSYDLIWFQWFQWCTWMFVVIVIPLYGYDINEESSLICTHICIFLAQIWFQWFQWCTWMFVVIVIPLYGYDINEESSLICNPPPPTTTTTTTTTTHTHITHRHTHQ